MIQIAYNPELHPNSLIQAECLKKDWANVCDIQIINLVIEDLKAHGFDIVEVEGFTSAWDATTYIDNETSCIYEIKLSALYTFSKCGGLIILDNQRIVGDVNLISKLISTNRISSVLAQKFIDESYTDSKKSQQTQISLGTLGKNSDILPVSEII